MNTPTLSWPQRTIVEIEPGERQAYVGRAAAFIINGVECMVMCQNLDDLTLVGDHLSGSFDANQFGKATLIQTDRLAVAAPPAPTLSHHVEPLPANVSDVVDQTYTAPDGTVYEHRSSSPQMDLIPKVDGQPIVEYIAPPETAPAPPPAVEKPAKRRGRPPKATRELPVDQKAPYDFDADDDEL